MKKEKFKGTINSKNYTSEKDFFEAYLEMLENKKDIKKMSYEHYLEDDGVTENQLDMFDDSIEKTSNEETSNRKTSNKKELVEAFNLDMPNFSEMICNENKKETFNTLIEKLMSVYDELSTEDTFSKNEINKYYGENIKKATKYMEDILADKETVFKEITDLRERINELNKKYNELNKLSNLCSRYLDYYDYLKFDTRDCGAYNNKEENILLESFDKALKSFGEIFKF